MQDGRLRTEAILVVAWVTQAIVYARRIMRLFEANYAISQ